MVSPGHKQTPADPVPSCEAGSRAGARVSTSDVTVASRTIARRGLTRRLDRKSAGCGGCPPSSARADLGKIVVVGGHQKTGTTGAPRRALEGAPLTPWSAFQRTRAAPGRASLLPRDDGDGPVMRRGRPAARSALRPAAGAARHPPPRREGARREPPARPRPGGAGRTPPPEEAAYAPAARQVVAEERGERLLERPEVDDGVQAFRHGAPL
jgi:hypothetical protein